MSDAEEIVRHLKEHNASGAIVVDGPADDIIAGMVSAGWTLEEGQFLVGGKRIRYIRPPACLFPCDDDCESGPAHCYWIHVPRHKAGWHSPEDCPMSRRATDASSA